MSVKYIPNGNAKIVIDKITYQNKDDKKAVLPVDKLSKEELEGLLKRKFIIKLDLDGLVDPAPSPASPPAKNAKPPKNKPGNNQTLEAKPREELLKEAKELGFTVTDEMTDEEIQKLIADAKAK